MSLRFSVDGQNIIRLDRETVAANSCGFLYSEFIFDPLWESLTKKAVFEKDSVSVCSIITDGKCYVPYEVLTHGYFTVSLIGIDSDKSVRVTTEKCRIDVFEGPSLEYDNSGEPVLSEIEQITTLAGHALETAKEAKKSVIEGSVDKETLEEFIGDYLKDNPIDKETVLSAVENALITAKESGEFDGPAGPQGPEGKQGIQGPSGTPGYTPQRGVDYWTEADKQEIKSYVDGVIEGIEAELSEL